MNKRAALAVAVAVSIAVAAAAILLTDGRDSGGDRIPVNSQYKVVIESDDYTKFTINGDGPWGSSEGYYEPGTRITLAAVTETGHFGGYYTGGECVCADAVYEFTVKSDLSISLVTKDLAALKIDGGKSELFVNGFSAGNYYEKVVTAGTQMTVYAVAAEGTFVTGWTGSVVSEYPVCSFAADSDMEISVSEKETSGSATVIAVAAMPSDGGSIAAYGQTVGGKYAVRIGQEGGPLRLSAAAADGHSFSHWILSTGDVYTDPDISISAGPERINVTCTFTAAPA